MPHDPRTTSYGGVLPRHVSPERARQLDDELRARLAGVPKGHVPYRVWSKQVDHLCCERNIRLAQPEDFTKRLQRPHPLSLPPSGRGRTVPAGGGETVTVEHLLQYQEQFYRDAYKDPAFSFDRSTLHLSTKRVTGILDALTRGEVNYPLVVATSRVLTAKEQSHTLHRVLMDRLIRGRRIKVWARTDPNVDTFLEQVRDLTLGDLTRTDLRDADGNTVAFDLDDGHWLPYFQALYPLLPRPTVQPGYTDLSFVAWEQEAPEDYVIYNAARPRGGAVTFQKRFQRDAVAFRYLVITTSQYLALFSQYYAATGEQLDQSVSSWTYGIVDPQRPPDYLAVYAGWSAKGLKLVRFFPGGVGTASGHLRSSR